MDSTVNQIRVQYEDLGMSIEDIASQESLDIDAIKAALMSCSSKYRKECKSKVELNFTEEAEQAAIEVITNTALYAEDPYLKLKAATYIRDDRRGRKDIMKAMANGIGGNILLFNQQLKLAKQAIERINKPSEPKLINIASSSNE